MLTQEIPAAPLIIDFKTEGNYPEPSVNTTFSAKGFEISEGNEFSIRYKNLGRNHINCMDVLFPIQPNIVKLSTTLFSKQYLFNCNNLDLLSKMKENINDLALIILGKANYELSNPKQYSYVYIGEPVSIYVVNKRTDEILLDLSRFKRSSGTTANKQKAKAWFDADVKAINLEQKTAKDNPKVNRRICGNCSGKGYVTTGRTGDYSRCSVCLGSGRITTTW